jgi:RNA polymerase sigma factor (sigma-70 family)
MAPLTAQSQPLSSASSQGAAEAAEGTGARRTDEELMAAYKEGEVAAFHELVKRHERPLYRFCLRSLGNQDAAADAAQEVFLRVVKNAARWERRAKFTTWMYTIARNFCIDEARKRNFRKTDSLNEKVGRDDDGGTEKLDQVADGGPGSDRLTDSMHIRQVVDLTLAVLHAPIRWAAVQGDRRSRGRRREHGEIAHALCARRPSKSPARRRL